MSKNGIPREEKLLFALLVGLFAGLYALFARMFPRAAAYPFKVLVATILFCIIAQSTTYLLGLNWDWYPFRCYAFFFVLGLLVHAAIFLLSCFSDSDETEEQFNEAGYVYVLTNPSFGISMFKAGCTDRCPDERARELSAVTGVPTPYLVVERWRVSDPFAAERAAHAALDGFRINRQREFFQGPYETLRSELYRAVEPFIV